MKYTKKKIIRNKKYYSRKKLKGGSSTVRSLITKSNTFLSDLNINIKFKYTGEPEVKIQETYNHLVKPKINRDLKYILTNFLKYDKILIIDCENVLGVKRGKYSNREYIDKLYDTIKIIDDQIFILFVAHDVSSSLETYVNGKPNEMVGYMKSGTGSGGYDDILIFLISTLIQLESENKQAIELLKTKFSVEETEVVSNEGGAAANEGGAAANEGGADATEVVSNEEDGGEAVETVNETYFFNSESCEDNINAESLRHDIHAKYILLDKLQKYIYCHLRKNNNKLNLILSFDNYMWIDW